MPSVMLGDTSTAVFFDSAASAAKSSGSYLEIAVMIFTPRSAAGA